MKEKLIIEIFVLHYLTINMRFLMALVELVIYS